MPGVKEQEIISRCFTNELGNDVTVGVSTRQRGTLNERVVIRLEGPTSEVENIITPREADMLIDVLHRARQGGGVTSMGVDICAVARVEETLSRHAERFLERLLTPAERAQKEWNAAQVARRWALKEATAKALGTGIGEAVGFQDIEVTYTPRKAPLVAVRGHEGRRFLASVADDAGVAVAVVMVGEAAKAPDALPKTAK